MLPKISHSTPLTKYLSFNYVMTAVAAIESGIVHCVIEANPEQKDLGLFFSLFLFLSPAFGSSFFILDLQKKM